jgi:hypothetical protein
MLSALVLMTAFPQGAGAVPDAKTLIRQVETQYMSKTSHSVFRMKVVTRSWTREMTLEAWGEGRDKMLSKIRSPKKDAGTATLKVGSEMWNYLPKIDRLMKIPSSLMGDRWMGSHLTNDDLVKEQKVDELYAFQVKQSNDKEATIVATPKPNAAVVWGSIQYRIDLEREIPLEVLYFDEDGEKVRTITFDQVRTIDGRTIPTRMRYVPADEPGEYTEMVYESIAFDRSLPKDLFSVRSLRK